MQSSLPTYEIEVAAYQNYDNRALVVGESDEGNIEVSIGDNAITIDDTIFDRTTRSMDPYYDYHDHLTGEIDGKVATEKMSNNAFTNESNPADCSTILSECFSGEDTAEATSTINTNEPMTLDDTQPLSSIPIEDYRSDVVAPPSPLRYFKDYDNAGRTTPKYFEDDSTSLKTTAMTNSHNLITKRYPKDPTTTPERLNSTAYVSPSMTMGTGAILNRCRPTTDVTNTASLNHDGLSVSIQRQSTIESKGTEGEDKYYKDGDNTGEVEDDDEEEELSWRMNPNKSMSDWTIEIQMKKVGGDNHTRSTPLSSNSVLYHVHKSVLAVGPRRSQYFVKLFRSSATRYTTTTNHTTTTILEMDELVAMAFPLLLDYMYGTQSNMIPMTTYNATALHVLAQQLEMKHLRTIVRNFWMQDLSMENIAIYYQHASPSKIYHTLVQNTQNTSIKSSGGGLDDPLIIRALEMYCAQHMFDVDSGNCTIADILDILDPQFMYNVIVQAHDNNEKYRMMNHTRNDSENTFSLRLSLIVAVYSNIHYETDLDLTMFQQLTDQRHLPVLESQAAKVFLELQEKLLGVPNATVTSLTDRCITVLSNQWEDACVKKNGKNSDSVNHSATTVTLPRLESAALVTFVSHAFLNATERINELESNNTELQTRNFELKQIVELTQNKVNTLEQANENLQRQLQELQKEMDTMKNSSAAMTNQSITNTTGSSNKTARGRLASTMDENCINGVVHVEFDDDHHDPTVDTTTACTDVIETNISMRRENDDPSPPQPPSPRVVQQPQRNAIDHGRSLLRRLDAPINTASTAKNIM